MNHILVTGASGYLGGRIFALLKERGAAVTGTSLRDQNFIRCDLTDEKSVLSLAKKVKADAVIHCAAKVPKSEKDYEQVDRRSENKVMLANLTKAGFAHIIFTSSMTVYSAETSMPAREEDISAQLAGYALGKRNAELFLLQNNAIRATILRLPGLFGPPRRSGLLYNAIYCLASEGHFRLSGKITLWAAMHVDDAAEICIRATASVPDRSRILNIGYPLAMSIPWAVRSVARKLNRPVCDLPEAPEFEMDLCKLSHSLGLPDHDFNTRLDEFIRWVKMDLNPQMKGLSPNVDM